VIEEFLPGREFTVALLGNGADVAALPIVEVNLDRLPAGAPAIYGFEAKWEWDTPDRPLDMFTCPARLSSAGERAIRAVSIAAFRALSLRDWARIDVRLDAEDRPRILEVNPLPGILPRPEQNSCFPKAARAAGMDHAALVRRVLDLAIERTGLRRGQRAADRAGSLRA
jgi:D-alanine-D-alanine ligase